MEHDKLDRALKTLHYFRDGSFTDDEVTQEFDEIKTSVDEYRASGLNWLSLFREPSLFGRLWRAALLQFMAQMCGATAMKYYLPTLFKVLGLSTRLSLLAGGIESTLKIGCTIVEMLIIDRVGRRVTMTAVPPSWPLPCWCVPPLSPYIADLTDARIPRQINGALPLAYPHNVNRASDYTCIVFVFIYSLATAWASAPPLGSTAPR